MSTDATPRLALDYVVANQAQKHVTVNGDLWRLDALVQMAVVSCAVAEAPADPEDGQAWLLPSAPVGTAWSGFEAGDMVRRDGALWVRVETPQGAVAWVEDEAQLIVLTADGWRPLGAVLGTVGPVAALGVGTDPDPDTPLVVRGDGARFEAAADDHRLVVNRTAGADTASMIFQTAHAGQAEIGLCGDDGLSLRTSADGATWRTALKAVATGRVGVNAATPEATLHVVSETAAVPTLTLVTLNGGTAGASLSGQKARGSASAPEGVLAGDRLFALYGRGYTSVGSLGTNSVAMQMSAAETFVGDAQGTVIAFETAPLGSSTRRAVVSFQPNGSLRLHGLAAAPASPQPGEIYFDSTLATFRGWNGSAWTALG